MLKYLRIVAAVAACTFAAPAFAETVAPESVGLSRERLARLTVALREQVERGRIPGAIVLVARDGKIAFFETVGFREKGAGAPMKTDAIFRIYSMTKPIASVAAMMLVEEGRILLSDPVSKHLPELKGLKVGIEKKDADGKPTLERVPVAREMTVQDLLRHTAGLSYGASAPPLWRQAVAGLRLLDRGQTSAEMLAKLATAPLAFQPGTVWEYGPSTDVLGVLIERVAKQPLDEFLKARILKPLGMNDTGFSVPAENQARIAEPLAADPETGRPIQVLDVRTPPRFFGAGGGMVSTASDYFRFTQLLLNGGELDGVRLLSRKTVEYMTADHLGPLATPQRRAYYPGGGYGWSLGFAVRTQPGLSAQPGSVGDYWWAGYGGTYFWIDPKERLVGILMLVAPDRGYPFWTMMRNMVYAAILH